MEQTINIELFKENPQFFFSQLPEKAEKEFQSLLEFIFFKYEITNLYTKKEMKKRKFDFFKENPINVEKIKKHTREELHER